MQKENNNIEIGYRVTQIQTLRFSFEDKNIEEVKPLFLKENQNLGLNVTTNMAISEEESTITIDLTTELLDLNKDKELIITHQGRTVYEMDGLAAFYEEDKEDYALPDELMIQLFALAFSHTRALVAVEVSPTVYKGYYMLPVIDPVELLNN